MIRQLAVHNLPLCRTASHVMRLVSRLYLPFPDSTTSDHLSCSRTNQTSYSVSDRVSHNPVTPQANLRFKFANLSVTRSAVTIVGTAPILRTCCSQPRSQCTLSFASRGLSITRSKTCVGKSIGYVEHRSHFLPRVQENEWIMITDQNRMEFSSDPSHISK